MNLRVSGISELIEDDGAGEFVRDLLSLRNGVDHENSGSVSTTSAPNCLSSATLSTDIVSGMVRMSL